MTYSKTIINTVLMSLMCLSITAQAKSYQTISEDVSEKRSKQTISYEILDTASSPAAEAINKAIKESMMQGLCGASEDEEFSEYYADMNAKISEENSNYVSVAASYDTYCGGAHPNYGMYYLTFNVQSGQVVDMDVEVPAQKYNDDYDAHEKFQIKLAEIMAANIEKNDPQLKDEKFQCLVDAKDSSESIAEFIKDMYPTLAGLGKDNSIIATISPPHAMAACTFDLSLSLKEVDSLVAPASVIRNWLTK